MKPGPLSLAATDMEQVAAAQWETLTRLALTQNRAATVICQCWYSSGCLAPSRSRESLACPV